jgi:hypothetical protein
MCSLNEVLSQERAIQYYILDERYRGKLHFAYLTFKRCTNQINGQTNNRLILKPISNITMKKLLALCIMLLPFIVKAQSDTVRILLNGNSITYRNNMFQIFMDMTAEKDTVYILTEAVAGGTSLSDRWNTYTYCKDSVEKGGHDFVTIQEYSAYPYWMPSAYKSWAERWDSLVRANGAQPVHWMNHCRNAAFNENMHTIDSITSLIGKETGSLVAPCGLAWERVFNDYPNDTSFLFADEVHPTYEGSYLQACIIYATITGKTPVGLLSLEADSATYLQTVAWETYTYYISGDVCREATINISADLKHTNSNEGEICLTVSGGTEPYTYLWSNSETSPDLTGLIPGTYSVTVTDDNGCKGSSSFVIDLNTGVKTMINPEQIEVYPNPAKNEIFISNVSQTSIQILDMQGSVIYNNYSNVDRIKIDNNFKKGIYVIHVINKDGARFIKKLIIE